MANTNQEIQFDFFEDQSVTIDKVVNAYVPDNMSTSEKSQLVIETLTSGVIEKQWVLCGSTSSGKDSSTMMSLSLAAMAKAVSRCDKPSELPPFYIVSSDTKMENLVKKDYQDAQFQNAIKFGERNGFKVVVRRPSPDRTRSFLRIFAGNKPDPDVRINSEKRECATDYKIDPIQREMRVINREAKAQGKKLVMLVGSRSEESKARSESLAKIDASHLEPVEIKGYNTLYPIKDWDLGDVWSYINFCEDDINAKMPGFQDGLFDTAKLYRTINSGECVAGLTQSKNPCSGRDGCLICTAIGDDKSGENQSDNSELYHLKRTLKDLLKLRNWRANLCNNFQNRNFVSMSNMEGQVNLTPGGYCGWVLEYNLEVALTIQAKEEERAFALSSAIEKVKSKIENGTIRNATRARKWLEKVKEHDKPLLQLVDESDIMWLDFQWGLHGLTRRAHSAIRIWDKVMNKGYRAEMPGKFIKRPSHITDKSFIYTSAMPQQARIEHSFKFELEDYSSLSISTEALAFSESNCSDTELTQVNKSGDVIETEMMNVVDKYDVCPEAAAFICADPDSFLSSNIDSEPYKFRHQNAVNRLIRLGVIEVNKTQLKTISRKLDYLFVTASLNLQELAYIGGPATHADYPDVKYGDETHTLSLF